MNTFALAEDKERRTLLGIASRCMICVEVSLRSFFPAAEVELFATALRSALLQAMLFCLRQYFQLHHTLRRTTRLVADCLSLVSISVGSVQPAQGSASGGTAVTIRGSGFSTGATVSFGGTSASAVVTAQTQSK